MTFNTYSHLHRDFHAVCYHLRYGTLARRLCSDSQASADEASHTGALPVHHTRGRFCLHGVRRTEGNHANTPLLLGYSTLHVRRQLPPLPPPAARALCLFTPAPSPARHGTNGHPARCSSSFRFLGTLPSKGITRGLLISVVTSSITFCPPTANHPAPHLLRSAALVLGKRMKNELWELQNSSESFQVQK